jgi:hypothetical protein
VSTSPFHSALALGGVEEVLLEVVEQGQRYAAAQHPAVDNRSLYAFLAELKYSVRSSETLTNANSQ